jgi:ribosomal protein S18 acetylase RimI-like enzyme
MKRQRTGSPNPAISVRAATLTDYDALCSVFSEGDAFHVQALPGVFCNADGAPRSREFIASMLAEPDAALFVAELDGEIAGLVTAAIRESPAVSILVPRRYGYVDSLIVLESLRRMGIGRLLIERVHQWALERGLDEVELNVWEFNEGAKSLYDSMGYATSRRTLRKRL